MNGHAQLEALADPTRRGIFERLAERPCSVGELAARVPVSRPAVSQHLRILENASLVLHVAEGARNIYRVDPRGLDAVRTYFDGMWSRALRDFKTVAETTFKGRRKGG